jgi:hypothetical protein
MTRTLLRARQLGSQRTDSPRDSTGPRRQSCTGRPSRCGRGASGRTGRATGPDAAKYPRDHPGERQRTPGRACLRSRCERRPFPQIERASDRPRGVLHARGHDPCDKVLPRHLMRASIRIGHLDGAWCLHPMARRANGTGRSQRRVLPRLARSLSPAILALASPRD